MRDLTKGNTVKTFLLFAIPIVLAGIINEAYTVIDTIMAGKFLGEVGLAAIGATSSFINFTSALFWGFGTGLSIYVAKLFGAGEFLQIKRVIYTAFSIMAAASIIISAVCVVFYDAIFDLLKVDSTIRHEAFMYYAVRMGGEIFLIFNICFRFFLHAIGDSAFTFTMSLLSGVFNIFGNAFFVLTLGLGAEGLALATVLAYVITDVVYIVKIRRCLDEMGVRDIRVKPEISSMREVLPYALPNAFQQEFMFLALLVVSAIVNGMGAIATASYTVVWRIYDINANIYTQSAKTVSNYTAQCVGAGKTDKIKKGFGIGILQGCVFLLPVFLACMIFPEWVCGMFFETDADPMAIKYALDFIKYALSFIFLQLLCNIFHALFRGVKSVKHLVVSTVVGAISRIVITLIVAKPFGMTGVYIAWVASWVIETAYSLIVYKFGHWLPTENKKIS